MQDPNAAEVFRAVVEKVAMEMRSRYGWWEAADKAEGHLLFVRHDTCERGKEERVRFWEAVKSEIHRQQLIYKS